MARSNEPHAETVYGVAGHWVDAALRGDESLFTWGSPVWTPSGLDDLSARFDAVDVDGDRPLVEGLAKALAGAHPEVIQLAGEAMVIHLLIARGRSLTRDRKLLMVETVLGWSPYMVDIPGDVALAFDDGLAAVGPDFHHDGMDHLRLIIDAVRRWKGIDPEQQSVLLAQPGEFRAWLAEVRPGTADAQRHALLHLVHPDAFEPIVVGEVKHRIVEAFAGGVASGTDIDQQLLDVRRSLEATRTPGFSFSDPKLRSHWDVDTTPWGTFVRFVEVIRSAHAHEAHDVDAVLDLASRMSQARRALDRGEPWADSLAVALATATHPGVTDASDRLLGILEDAPSRVEAMLRTVWSAAGSPAHRLGVATDDLEVGALLLAASDPTTTPPYLASAHTAVAALVDEPLLASEGAADRYGGYLEFLDRVVAESARRGVDVPDRLAAASAMWALTQVPIEELTRRRHVGAAEAAGIDTFRRPVAHTSMSEHGAGVVEGLADVAGLADACLLDEGWLSDVIGLLEHRRHIVLTGPTAIGKSYLARCLAHHLAGPDGSVDVMQFHPGVGYTELVEGTRSDPSGRVMPQIHPGVLRRLVSRATTAPTGTHVLVIDDAGRGDLLTALGEVYAVLGSPDGSVALHLSGTTFAFPDNVHLILTASSDQPLGDAALRRRFPVVALHPQSPPVEGLLRRYLDRHQPDMMWLADVVDRANARIGAPLGGVAPGHFLGMSLDAEVVRHLWRYVVLPEVAETVGSETVALLDLDDLRGADWRHWAPPRGDGGPKVR